jgi:vancomycin resistance protein YoaR
MLFTALLAAAAVGGCDRKSEDRTVVEVKKPVEVTGTEPSTVKVETIDLETERSALSKSVEERTARLDARIDELEKRGDEKSKEAAATLRAKRDQARAKMNELGTRTQENWQAFKRDVSDAWDQLERDVNEATR